MKVTMTYVFMQSFGSPYVGPFISFCPPPSLREEGGLLNLPSSVHPSVCPSTQITFKVLVEIK